MEFSSCKSSCIHEQYTSLAVRGPKSKGVKNRVQQRWHTSILKFSPRMEISRFNSRCDVTRAKGGVREGRGGAPAVDGRTTTQPVQATHIRAGAEEGGKRTATRPRIP